MVVMRNTFHWLVAVAVLGGLALPAHAYLDPASGSMFLQLVLGGVAGLAVAFKLYWRKIVAAFGGKKPESDSDDTSA